MSIKCCVIGGGNASHVFAAFLSSRGYHTNIYAPFQDEAKRLQEGIARKGGMLIKQQDGTTHFGKPAKVSKNPADVIPEADFIIMPLPAFAYVPMLNDLKPHLKKGVMIGSTPGGGGFDWAAYNALGEKFKDVIVFGLRPLPMNCRITTFGEEVFVLGWKTPLSVATWPIAENKRVAETVEKLLGITCGVQSHFLLLFLDNGNIYIHSQRNYGLLKDHKTGQEYDENPLFYEGMDEFSADQIQGVDDEIHAIAGAIDAKYPQLNLVKELQGGLYKRLILCYGNAISNQKNLCTCFQTNEAYKNLRFPMTQLPNKKWVPDFTSRYYTEDIPYGLLSVKALAEMTGIDTPTTDKVLIWAQEHMKTKYIDPVTKKLLHDSPDVKKGVTPQKFGINSLEKLCVGF